jgi:enhancing lycopene biosynthesis protein 2
MKKFAVVLAGCGVYDGAEIHEAVVTLLAIDRNKCSYQIFAPDIDQYHVINHLKGEVTSERRNVLEESARIARGNIQALSEFNPDTYDAIIFPGGFGCAKNLSTFALNGADCEVNPDVENAVLSMVKANKPVGALCIAPAVIARILKNVDVTIGNDENTAANIEKTGSHHIKTNHGEVVKDSKLKVFSTPCYMLDASISQIADGAENIVKAMIKEF